MPLFTKFRDLSPGLAHSLACAALGLAAQKLSIATFGTAPIEALVIAMLLGIAWRNSRGLSADAKAGVRFAGKEVLEAAVVLLGASVDFRTVAARGPMLLVSVAVVVALVIELTARAGQFFGLNRRTAVLIGVGHGICGNSAIAAVAPVIGAKDEEIASSIGLTAVLSIFVVLLLPFATQVLSLTNAQHGIVAGMVVYAVPQVLAATFTVSPESVTVATLVKLTRVLFLSPVVLFLSWREGVVRSGEAKDTSGAKKPKILPWFMLGFLVLAALRSLGVLSAAHGDSLREGGKYLTILSMGAIGLGVDLKALRGNGKKLVATVLVSLALLCVAGLGSAYWLNF